MYKFFKKNIKSIISLISVLLLGVILGLTIAYFCPLTNFGNNIESKIPDCNDSNLNTTKMTKEESTIIDGVILSVDLSKKNIEINATNLISLSDLEKTKPINENLIINIADTTNINLLIKESNKEKTIKLEDLMINDSVAIIINQNLIDSFSKENLVASFVKVIK